MESQFQKGLSFPQLVWISGLVVNDSFPIKKQGFDSQNLSKPPIEADTQRGIVLTWL